MSTLITNAILGLLGTGSMLTAVALPSSLIGRIGEIKEQKHKSSKDWSSLEDFKNYCWGDFLKEEGKGELIVCLDKSQEVSGANLLFYLRWKEQDTNRFLPIEKISIGSARTTDWEINFYIKEETRSKLLKVKIIDHKDLVALQSNSLQELQDRCKSSKRSGADYQLKCAFTSGNFAEVYTKIAKKSWFI